MAMAMVVETLPVALACLARSLVWKPARGGLAEAERVKGKVRLVALEAWQKHIERARKGA